MTPEYLEELADIADPEKLWMMSGLDKLELPPEKRKQLDVGVALRRHARHVRLLRELLKDGKSLLITPLSPNGSAIKAIEMPPEHQKLRRNETPNAN
jgi:hypothetical protein